MKVLHDTWDCNEFAIFWWILKQYFREKILAVYWLTSRQISIYFLGLDKSKNRAPDYYKLTWFEPVIQTKPVTDPLSSSKKKHVTSMSSKLESAICS